MKIVDINLDNEMRKKEIENIIYNDLSPDKYALVHNYIANLQLGIEIKTQRIKEEQQEKELYKRSYNELKQNKLSDIDYQEIEQRLKDCEERLNNTDKFVSKLNSKGKDCRIYANIKLDILNKLRGKE